MHKMCLFGGTFNPIHMGHVELALRVQNAFELDKTVIIPSNISPHKSEGVIDPLHRVNMAQLAFDDKGNHIDVSRFEIDQKGVSYTHKTLQYFRSMYPEAVLYFLTGTDIFATIESWKNWESLFDYAHFIVVNRKEKTVADMKDDIPKSLHARFALMDNIHGVAGNIVYFEMDEVPVSSTEIRNDILNNKKNDFLPEVVYDYIKKNNLYRGSNG